MTVQAEFQAVLLAAGRGSRMPELTASMPKCLLPVGPKPLIFYPLYKLQLSGFTECIVIVFETQKVEIQAAVDKCNLDIKIEYFPIPANEDLGTADSLRLVHDKLHSDVLVIPCDLILDVQLKEVVNTFRKHKSSISTLFLRPQSYDGIGIPGPKSKHKPEKDIVFIDANTGRLIFLASASDFESEIPTPKKLFKKHPKVKVHCDLLDSHIYILKNWVIKYLKHLENVSSLKGEFLPHIIKKQLAKAPNSLELTPPSIINPQQNDDIFTFAKEDEYTLLIRELSAFNDHTSDSQGAYHGDCIRCYATISDVDSFGIRINTLPSYCFISEKISEYWNRIVPTKELVPQHSKAEIQSTQVDDKCIIWEGAKLNQKTSFKNSIIGANVEVNSFSRVFNSVLMKNVVIYERVALENCIVGNGAIIGAGTQLKSCIVGSNHNVADQSQHTNEVLTDSDRLMEF